MAPMAKIREVEEVSSQDASSSISSEAVRQIMAILSSSTPGSLFQAREHIAQLPADEDPQALQGLENALSEGLWEQTKDTAQVDPQRAEALMLCIDALVTHTAKMPASLTLLRVAAFTNPDDPWSSPAASGTAQSMLSRALKTPSGGLENGQQQQQTVARFIVDTVLQSYLRPLFSKASSKLTPSGRPAAYQEDPTLRRDTRLNQEIPPWKAEGPRAVTVFRWAVTNADEDLLKANWPLFTPVLLTLAEAEESTVRLAGLTLLTPFVKRCPPSILHMTGLATVFEDAAFPSLLHLPSLTPEPESVRITAAAYDVLLAIAGTHETSAMSTTSVSASVSGSKVRNELLDRILRRGIFIAYDHASQYVGVVEVLMRTTATVINLMGIHATKHLQRLLAVIAAIMTDPFMVSHQTTILQATKALNACITTCWPRLVTSQQEQGRLIRIVSICWINMHDGDPQARNSSIQENGGGSLAEELKRTAKMISALQKASTAQPLSNLAEIVLREPLLSTLFQA